MSRPNSNYKLFRGKGGQNISFASNDKGHIVEVDDLDPNYTNFVIFDDFVTEKVQKNAEDLFVRGRKRNASTMYISQSYFETPRIILVIILHFSNVLIQEKLIE